MLKTNQGPLENSCRPAVDVLFRSVCDIYKAKSLGVILTGLGQDGLIGCEQIKKVGGQVVVQNEETSVVWGMPGFVANPHAIVSRATAYFSASRSEGFPNALVEAMAHMNHLYHLGQVTRTRDDKGRFLWQKVSHD